MLDNFEHSIFVFEHIVVPESENRESRIDENTCSLCVNSIRVLTAVEFHNERSLQAHEIKDVVGERMLSPEFAVLDLPGTETLPK